MRLDICRDKSDPVVVLNKDTGEVVTDAVVLYPKEDKDAFELLDDSLAKENIFIADFLSECRIFWKDITDGAPHGG